MSDQAEITRYRTAVLACHVAARMLAEHELAELLADIERADTMGPFLDPTLWRDRRAAMLEDREVIAAAMNLWKLGRKLGGGV
jgi:hypothetical protein